MSYILDALRKSEAEHSRETPPSLATTAPTMATSRRGFTIALVAVIAVNLVLVALWLTGWQPWNFVAQAPEATITQPVPDAETAAATPVIAPVPAPVANPPAVTASPEPTAPIAESVASSASVPTLDVSTHVYSADAQFSAVTINGRRRTVGDVIAPDTRLIEVTETGVVVDYRGERVVIDVLQDWR